jgi:hypothetical protein
MTSPADLPCLCAHCGRALKRSLLMAERTPRGPRLICSPCVTRRAAARKAVAQRAAVAATA